MRFPRKDQILECLLIGLWGLAPLIWFMPEHMIITTDLHVPVDAHRWIKQLCAWNSQWGTGFEWSIGFSNLIFSGVSALLSLVLSNIRMVQQCFFIIWFLLPGISNWLLAQELFPEQRISRLAMVNFYMFNLYHQVLWGGNEAALAAYAALPLILWITIKAFRTRRYLFYLGAMGIASLVLSAASMNLPILVVVLMAWAVLVLVLVIKERLWSQGKRWVPFVIFLLSSVALAALCNAFWAAPQAFVNQAKVSMPAFSSEMISETKSWLNGMSSYTSLANVVRMQGDWTWFQGWYEPYRSYSALYRSHPAMLVFSWFVPLVVLVGALMTRLRYRSAWIGCAVLGVVLSCGVHPPFGVFYGWLVDHFPFFWVFRSPWFKFTLLTCIGYSILFGEGVRVIARGVSKFVGKQHGASSRQWVAGAVFSVLILANMGYAFPVTLGRMHPKPAERTKLTPAHVVYPEHVKEAAKWLNDQKGFFRTIHLPAHQNGWSIYRWGLGSTSPAWYPFVDHPLLFHSTGGTLDFGNRMTATFLDAFYGPNSIGAFQIPSLLGAEYLLYEKDFDHDYYESDASYPRFGDDPTFIEQRLKRFPEVEYQRSFGDWDIYQLPKPRPRFQLANRVGVVLGGLEAWVPLTGTSAVDAKRTFVFLDGVEDEMELRSLQDVEALGLMDTLVIQRKPTESELVLLDAWLAKSKKSLYLFGSTTEMIPSVQSSATSSGQAIKLTWTEETYRSEPDSTGRVWRWMKAGDPNEPHMVLYNGSGKAQKINLQWRTLSYGQDRSLYIYLNDVLKKTFPLKADEPDFQLLRDFEVPPGENTIRFYSPYSWNQRNEQRVSFAFEEDSFKIGLLTFRGSIWIPQDGNYSLSMVPQPIPEPVTGTLRCRLSDQKLKLTANRSNGAFELASVWLTRGDHAMEVDQLEQAQGYLVRAMNSVEEPAIKPDPLELQYEPVGSSKYLVTFQTKTPAVLVFRESYYPFWRMRDSKGQTAGSQLIADGFGNGFILPSAGKYQMEVFYEVQQWFRLGWRLSLVGVLLSVLALGFGWIRRGDSI